jgi:hypothetical protein
MDIGTLLVIIAIVLAAISLFIHRSWLLAAAVLVGFVGVLFGADPITISS